MVAQRLERLGEAERGERARGGGDDGSAPARRARTSVAASTSFGWALTPVIGALIRATSRLSAAAFSATWRWKPPSASAAGRPPFASIS